MHDEGPYLCRLNLKTIEAQRKPMSTSKKCLHSYHWLHTACESYLSFGSAYGATSFVSYVIEDFDAKPW
jgi:hypothetical protein